MFSLYIEYRLINPINPSMNKTADLNYVNLILSGIEERWKKCQLLLLLTTNIEQSCKNKSLPLWSQYFKYIHQTISSHLTTKTYSFQNRPNINSILITMPASSSALTSSLIPNHATPISTSKLSHASLHNRIAGRRAHTVQSISPDEEHEKKKLKEDQLRRVKFSSSTTRLLRNPSRRGWHISIALDDDSLKREKGLLFNACALVFMVKRISRRGELARAPGSLPLKAWRIFEAIFFLRAEAKTLLPMLSRRRNLPLSRLTLFRSFVVLFFFRSSLASSFCSAVYTFFLWRTSARDCARKGSHLHKRGTNNSPG